MVFNIKHSNYVKDEQLIYKEEKDCKYDRIILIRFVA